MSDRGVNNASALVNRLMAQRDVEDRLVSTERAKTCGALNEDFRRRLAAQFAEFRARFREHRRQIAQAQQAFERQRKEAGEYRKHGLDAQAPGLAGEQQRLEAELRRQHEELKRQQHLMQAEAAEQMAFVEQLMAAAQKQLEQAGNGQERLAAELQDQLAAEHKRQLETLLAQAREQKPLEGSFAKQLGGNDRYVAELDPDGGQLVDGKAQVHLPIGQEGNVEAWAGTLHRAAASETLAQIAKARRVDLKTLQRVNPQIKALDTPLLEQQIVNVPLPEDALRRISVQSRVGAENRLRRAQTAGALGAITSGQRNTTVYNTVPSATTLTPVTCVAQTPPPGTLQVNPQPQGDSNACGTASLAGVLTYWQNATSSDNNTRAPIPYATIDDAIRPFNSFTSADAMVEYARTSHDMQTSIKNEASLGDLTTAVDQGVPVITLLDPDSPKNANLHYVTVIGYVEESEGDGDISHLWISDSGLCGSVYAMPVADFESKWSNPQILAFNTGYNNLAVFVAPKAGQIVGLGGIVRPAADIQLPKSTLQDSLRMWPVRNLGRGISDLLTGIHNRKLGNFAAGLVRLAAGFPTWLLSKIPGLRLPAGGLAWVEDKVADVVTQVGNFAGKVVKRAWDGVKSVARHTWNGVKSVARRAWDGLKKIFETERQRKERDRRDYDRTRTRGHQFKDGYSTGEGD